MEAFCRVSSNPNDYRKLEIILVGRALGTHQHSGHAHQYVRKHISTWMQTAPCTSATGTSVSCTLTLTLSTLHTYIYTVPINTVHTHINKVQLTRTLAGLLEVLWETLYCLPLTTHLSVVLSDLSGFDVKRQVQLCGKFCCYCIYPGHMRLHSQWGNLNHGN